MIAAAVAGRMVVSPAACYYIGANAGWDMVKGVGVTDTGLQKLAFFLLVATILYVAITGGT